MKPARNPRYSHPATERAMDGIFSSTTHQKWCLDIHKLESIKQEGTEQQLKYLRTLLHITQTLVSHLGQLQKKYTKGDDELVNDWLFNMTTLATRLSEERDAVIRERNYGHNEKVFGSVLEFESAAAKANERILGLSK